jgi:integrase
MNKKILDSKQPLALPNEQTVIPALSATHSLSQYLKAATSDNTRKAYRSAIRQFEKWGGRLPTDEQTIVQYLLERAEDLNSRTLDLHLTAISQWHHVQGFMDPAATPLVRKTMEGIRRIHGKPKHKAKALRLEHLTAMLAHLRQLPDSKKKHRDIAILLVNFFGAFRRSELVLIQVSDLIWEPEGLIIQLTRSKTDQDCEGLSRAIPFGDKAVCPASALKLWLEVAEINEGPIFRPVNRWDQIQAKSLSPGAINELLKTLGTACEFDFVPELSSHSFRRGLSTSAARERIDFELIKKQGGWKSDTTVWGYIEEGQQFTNNATVVLMKKMSEIIEGKNW